MGWEEVTITDLEAKVSLEILLRGREYYHGGQLLRLCKYREILAGEVAGTGGNYRIRLWLEGDQIAGNCSCPYPGFCKHMIVLVLAWLEKPKDFIDLQPQIEKVLSNFDKLRNLTESLIEKDPLGLLAVIHPATRREDFLTARGIHNLIRNTFKTHYFTHRESGALWEEIKRVQELVSAALARKEKDAPELLRELITGVALNFQEYPHPLLEESFQELLSMAATLPGSWSEAEIRPVADLLLKFFLEPSLWQLAMAIPSILICFHRELPGWLYEKLENQDWGNLSQTELIAFYELLTRFIAVGLLGVEYLEQVSCILAMTREGRLWLIDRLAESDPDQAYSLAKEGLRTGSGEEKLLFREQLIQIHLKRDEKKQAAALSFIQFEAEPNFEEYLRLKGILEHYPGDWQNYLRKMEHLLEKPGFEELTVKIAIDKKDPDQLITILKQVTLRIEVLNQLAEGLLNDKALVYTGVYPLLILKLLALPRSGQSWQTALKLLTVYKKTCKQLLKTAEWEELRQSLQEEHGGNYGFNKKFSAILEG